MMVCCSSATKQWTDWCVAYCLRLARISCDDAAGSGVPASAHIWSHKSRTRSASRTSIGLIWVMLVSSPRASFNLVLDRRQQLGAGERLHVVISQVAKIFDAPPHGKHRLCQSPVAHPCAVEAKLPGQLVHAACHDAYWLRVLKHHPQLFA